MLVHQFADSLNLPCTFPAPSLQVHQFADSQFGHIFAHGKTRAEAQRKIMLAVRRIRCIGEIHTNITSVEERPAAGAGRV